MTTTITVKANHGWSVKVTPINPSNGDIFDSVIVPDGTIQDFHVWDGRDLIIHEIRSDENQNLPSNYVMITNEQFHNLIESDKILDALIQYGVDNWDGYDLAIESLE